MICNHLTRAQSNKLYLNVLKDRDVPAMQKLCREDLFFLLTIGFKRKDVNKDFLYERCREVEKEPDGHLDLWSREHYKSTIITYAKTIQDILIDPEITVGIFSHTRPIAKAFLSQIKREFEGNDFLKDLFPDILYREPNRESPCWSLDTGILVKRRSNNKEKTVEAAGLESMPTGKHYSLLVYDDIVTLDSVSNTEMINKITDAWALSLNLGAHGGRVRYIGTRYHFNDTWKTVMDRGAAIPRIHPATDNGKVDGTPVFLDQESLDKKRREMGPFVFSAQMLQDPAADRAMGFQREWLKFYDILKGASQWNHYILVDPASEKKRTSDYTVILVVALGPDNNYYLIDGVRDRMNLTERTNKVFDFHRRYRPIKVGYEKYGMQSDIEHIEYVQQQEGYRFNIIKLGGQSSKEDRIRKLIPVFEQGRLYLPHTKVFVDYEMRARDLIREFIEDEYVAFPVSIHDDMMDCLARIIDPDLDARFPEVTSPNMPACHNVNNFDKVETDYDFL